jgi:hypothetical protein
MRWFKNGGNRIAAEKWQFPRPPEETSVCRTVSLPVHLSPVAQETIMPVPQPSAPLSQPAATRPAEDRERKRGALWLLLVPVVFLGMGLLAVVARDVLFKPDEQAAIMSEKPRPVADLRDDRPRIDCQFLESDNTMYVAANNVMKPANQPGEPNGVPLTWKPSMRFGLLAANEPNQYGQRKKLTFSENGVTNNTSISLDGQNWLFGEQPLVGKDGRPVESLAPGQFIVPGRWKGRWEQRSEDLGTTTSTVGSDMKPTMRHRIGRRSIWVYDEERVRVTQTVEIVPGPQSRLLDTALVTYLIENQDATRSHSVGVRFLLDTYIGANDGVPFTIPGDEQLCDTSKVFDGPKTVPDYIYALENQDLKNQGTVVQVHFKFGGSQLEAPNKVTLGAWPSGYLRGLNANCVDGMTMWDVPVFPIKEVTRVHPGSPPDSAVVMYWDPKEVAPGKSRLVGFGYGLGQVASGDDAKGRLGLSVGGTLVVNYTFSVTALVADAADGETVTLQLPKGLKIVSGERTQNVPPPSKAGNTSPVTWRVEAGSTAGTYDIKVTSNKGLSQQLPVTIKQDIILGGSGK